MATETGRGFGTLGSVLFAAIGLGAMGVLVVVLVQGNEAGREGIVSYVSRIRAGEEVGPDVGGAEALALTQALRATESVSVRNFIHQAGTACFWVGLHQPEGTVAARFVLADAEPVARVTSATLTRSCDCPDDADEPCVLR